MSSAASASLSSGERIAPGVLFRASALASAVAVGLVVVSAVLELGTTHWGIAVVALPLLVANVVLARLAYSSLRRLTVLALASFELDLVSNGGACPALDAAGSSGGLHGLFYEQGPDHFSNQSFRALEQNVVQKFGQIGFRLDVVADSPA